MPPARCSGSRCGWSTCRPSRPARRRPVAQAVVRRAQVRAALDHLRGMRSPGCRHRSSRRACRRAGCAARSRARDLVRVRAARTSRSSTPRRCRPCRRARSRSAGSSRPARCPEAVGSQVLPGELALPGVRHGLPPGRMLVAPGELAPSSPPRAAYSHSASVGSSLPAHAAYASASSIRDVHHRVAVAAVDRRARAARVASSARPARTPTSCGSRRGRPGRAVLRKTSEPGTSSSGSASGIVGRVERALGDGDVAGRPHEAANSAAVTGCSSIQKPSTATAVDRPLLGIEVLRAHRERAAGNHASRPGRGCSHQSESSRSDSIGRHEVVRAR